MASMESRLSGESPRPRDVSDAQRHSSLATAIDSLKPKDKAELEKYARRRMAGVTGTAAGWEDLINEAYLRTLQPEGRTWNRNVPLVWHLLGCMRSIADQWEKHDSKYTELPPIDPPARENVEAAVRAKINTQRLQSIIRNPLVLKVLETMLEGRTPMEARRLLNIDDNVYRAARRTIAEQFDRLFDPSRRTSRQRRNSDHE